MEDYVKAQTTCPICLEIMKDPKSLSCLHTFCSGCIKSLIKRMSKKTKTKITCPYCKAVSAVKDIKEDFKIKELICIRTGAGAKTPDYTATKQLRDHLDSLKFLKERYKCRLDEITAANRPLELNRIIKLGAYKRRWIDAFERECDRAVAAVCNSAETDNTCQNIKRNLAGIEAVAAEVEEMLENPSAGPASVKQASRFGVQIVKYSRHFPPKAPSLKLPDMQYLDKTVTDDDMRAQVHSCFTLRYVEDSLIARRCEGEADKETVSQPVSQPVCQPVSTAVNKSVNKPMDQPVSQTVVNQRSASIHTCADDVDDCKIVQVDEAGVCRPITAKLIKRIAARRESGKMARVDVSQASGVYLPCSTLARDSDSRIDPLPAVTRT